MGLVARTVVSARVIGVDRAGVTVIRGAREGVLVEALLGRDTVGGFQLVGVADKGLAVALRFRRQACRGAAVRKGGRSQRTDCCLSVALFGRPSGAFETIKRRARERTISPTLASVPFPTSANTEKMSHPVVGAHAQLDRQHLPLLHRLEDGPVAVVRAVPLVRFQLVLLGVSYGMG